MTIGTTTASGIRPQKMNQQPSNHLNQGIYNSSVSNKLSNQNGAWRAVDLSAKQSNNSRQINSRFAHQNNVQQLTNTQPISNVMHPSMIKTNNLMMDSIISNKSDVIKKPSNSFNNTIAQPLQHLNYGSVQKVEKQSPNEINRWRNKSIEQTPDQIYDTFSMHKRGNSTIVMSDLANQSVIVASNNTMIPNHKRQQTHSHLATNNNYKTEGTQDYSYNIGSQFKQNSNLQNTTKFSDLKFHHTTIDFNKNST